MSSSWTAKSGDWSIRWSDAEPYLEGTASIIVRIQREVFANDIVMVTPTGPGIESKLEDPIAVAVVVSRLYPEATFTNFPDVEALWREDNPPEDAVF